MSELKVCANQKCKETSRHSTLQFFPFPKNTKQFRQWLERSGRKDLLKKPSQSVDRTYFLCEKHFHKFDLLNNGKKRLPFDAIPLEFGKIYTQSASRFRTRVGGNRDSPIKKKIISSVKKTVNTVEKFNSSADESIINKANKLPKISETVENSENSPVTKKLSNKGSLKSSISTKLKSIKLPSSKKDEKEFNLEVFKDVDSKEIMAYKKLFPELEDITNRPVHCTSCNSHIGTAPINEAIIKMHPVLRVIQCKKCYTFYTSGEFERGEDGSEFYCRWCGQGGEVYCCSNCPKVFCRRCIEQNLPKGKVDEIQNNENWICFSCDPACMTQLRADYWALLNFIEKQKKDITNKSLSEKELNEAMSKDCSKCCVNIKKRMYGKRKVSHSKDASPPLKRVEMEPKVSEPPTIINDVLAKRAQDKQSLHPDGIAVRCTTDINSSLNSGKNDTNTSFTSPSQMRLIRQLKVVPITSTPLPVQPASQPIQQNQLLDVHTAPPTKNPVFHTINGYRVDLNSAAQQETYRLPNGKLIQVRKQQPMLPTVNKPTPPAAVSGSISASTVNTPKSIPPTLNSPILTAPTVTSPTLVPLTMGAPTLVAPTITASTLIAPTLAAPILNAPTVTAPTLNAPLMTAPMLTTPILSNPILTPVRPIVSPQNVPMMRAPPPLVISSNNNRMSRPAGTVLNRTIVRGRGRGRGRPSLIVKQIRPPIHPQQQIHRNASETTQSVLPENEIHITSLSQTVRKRKKPADPSMIPINSPVEKAKSQFAVRVENSMEVCEHIIGKMKTLTSSTAFKSVKTLTDVKDLTIHLSYLLTYAVGRFKTLQEKCGGDMKEMGFDPDSPKSDDDDIEILEPNTTLIEIDSDENETTDSERETRSAVQNLLNVENMEENVPEPFENELDPPIVNQNSKENETETINVIEIPDDQPEINTVTSEVITTNGYDIAEIPETENADKNKTDNSNKDVDNIKETENVVSEKPDTNQNSTETIIKDKSVDNEVNLKKIVDNTMNSNNETDATDSIEKAIDSTVPPTERVNEIDSEETSKSKTSTVENKLEKEINSDKKSDEPDEDDVNNDEMSKSIEKSNTPKDSKTNENNPVCSEHINKTAVEPANEKPSTEKMKTQDTETEQLQKLLEETDEIESPPIENLSGDMDDDQPQSKSRTNSEITINVNNVESIDEDIFENLIEEVNEVGENTNDESLVSDINENDDNLEGTTNKDVVKQKRIHDNSMDVEQLEDLSETEDNMPDENDLDLSLSSEIVLDPESDKVDEEMDVVNEDDKNVGDMDYLEEEIIENFEVVTEATGSMGYSNTKNLPN